jgi:hypothetical protein
VFPLSSLEWFPFFNFPELIFLQFYKKSWEYKLISNEWIFLILKEFFSKSRQWIWLIFFFELRLDNHHQMFLYFNNLILKSINKSNILKILQVSTLGLNNWWRAIKSWFAKRTIFDEMGEQSKLIVVKYFEIVLENNLLVMKDCADRSFECSAFE